ncbi:hypothetical protein ACHHYP_08418 [Achlya hypogyna]|uniref:TOG domain-containing protein n=1 Tax=Achlya hypogyna TaxID=1202772 RepID=A0A1V9YPQ1_ACHHY|nr:hypothetical protein ACHHYP_08418 [Achlya hypogyna]
MKSAAILPPTLADLSSIESSDDVGDDKGVTVLATTELSPLADPANEIPAALRRIDDADWLVQYEAIEIFRRALVHHAAVAGEYVAAALGALTAASLNLRSATSKNALLALAECFEFADVRALSIAPVVQALMKRAACEKRFLRDAAMHAVTKLATHVATAPVLVALAAFSASKSAKLCTAACSGTMLCLTQMQRDGTILTPSQLITGQIVEILPPLARFRSGKDAKAREDALVSLQVAASFAGGNDIFEKLVSTSIGDKVVATKLLQAVIVSNKRKVLIKAPGLRVALQTRKQSAIVS